MNGIVTQSPRGEGTKSAIRICQSAAVQTLKFSPTTHQAISNTSKTCSALRTGLGLVWML